MVITTIIIISIIIILIDGHIRYTVSTMQNYALFLKIFDPMGIYMSKWTV